jgi:hypothetical protein
VTNNAMELDAAMTQSINEGLRRRNPKLTCMSLFPDYKTKIIWCLRHNLWLVTPCNELEVSFCLGGSWA